MYIKKYWYNYIGGTDDSLTLVDYLYDKGKTEIPLSEIFNDTGLSKLNWNFHISPNLEYIDSEGQCHEFYYAIDLATDLAALILESKKSGGFNIKNLFDGEKRDRFVKIITMPEEDQAMNRALAEFCASPLEYSVSPAARFRYSGKRSDNSWRVSRGKVVRYYNSHKPYSLPCR